MYKLYVCIYCKILGEGPSNPEEFERELLRQDRHKERQRERNIARAAPDKRSKLQRDRERDISEQIALGMPARGQTSNETQFDQRLFGQSQGLGQGFTDDDGYNVYDKPWREGGSMANHLYRPSKNIDKEMYGQEDLEKIVKTNRYVLLVNTIICYRFVFLDLFRIRSLEGLIVMRLVVDLVRFSLKKKRIRSVWISS